MSTNVTGTTAELVTRARAGDTRAFEQLVRAHERQAYGYARSRLGDAHRAQDATQDAMLAAYHHLDRLQQPSRFGAWLRGIVRFQCLRQLRVRDMDLLPEEILLGLDDPVERAGAREEARQLRAHVRTLPSHLRDVVHLFYGTGCSQREVAAFLGLSPSTVNNRLHQARQTLRKDIQMTTLNDTPLPEGFAERVGTILAVDGPAVTVRFDGAMPDVFDVLSIPTEDGTTAERMRVTRLLDDGQVRCVAVTDLEGVAPGGRLLNTKMMASPGAHVAPVEAGGDLPVVLTALAGERVSEPTLLETGIKPLDLFAPLAAGGRVALIGGNGVGKVVLLEELRHRLAPGDQHLFFLTRPMQAGLLREMKDTNELEIADADDAAETYWLVAEGGSDPRYAEQVEGFDSVAYCTPLLAIRGLYPALDPAACRGIAVTGEHHDVATRARALLAEAKSLMLDPVALELMACGGMRSAITRTKSWRVERLALLSPEQRTTVTRAERLEAYMTTPFYVAEDFTKRGGVVVPLATTLADVAAILDGAADGLDLTKMLYRGSLDEMR